MSLCTLIQISGGWSVHASPEGRGWVDSQQRERPHLYCFLFAQQVMLHTFPNVTVDVGKAVTLVVLSPLPQVGKI